ncbi:MULTISPECIES: hypothetical protein [unclassified Nostoc]|nr:hypothetical protein [Nostoc sp. S13]MDF5740157.1 hypothetical protein [Nostoc sp. S13]
MNQSAAYECDAWGGQRDHTYAVVWYVCDGVAQSRHRTFDLNV